jgi:UDP-N-acetylglucosamine 2-epimerase (non-hydrolysing)
MPAGLSLVDPLGYVEFLSLEADAAAVLTDSGGLQEETTHLGVPCFTLRANTERPVTVRMGTNTLLGLDPARIADIPALLGHAPANGRTRPPLWDGRAAARVADVLLDGRAAPAPAYVLQDETSDRAYSSQPR